MHKKVPVSLDMISSPELSRSVAADLIVPDPTGIIAKEIKKANENSTKYDRGSGSLYNIQDLFTTSK
jgi:hypothetical protein